MHHVCGPVLRYAVCGLVRPPIGLANIMMRNIITTNFYQANDHFPFPSQLALRQMSVATSMSPMLLLCLPNNIHLNCQRQSSM